MGKTTKAAEMKVAIVGMGKIGLPIAAQLLRRGFEVIGCDVNKGVVRQLNEGKVHIIEPGIENVLKNAIKKNKFHATTETTSAVKNCKVAIIIVPLIVNKNKKPDFSAVDAATISVARGIQKGALVIYETTLPVGTTRNRLLPMLAKHSGLSAPQFSVAFSPERVYSGRILQDLRAYPKIVGGVDKKSTNAISGFYKKVFGAGNVIAVKNSETAEFTKLAGMTYRDVNIALANEFAKFAELSGIDYAEAAKAENTNPFSHLLLPGIGVGGHCAPVYPYFLIENAKKLGLSLKIPKIARDINDSMSGYALSKLKSAIGALKNKKVLLLGLAYREDVKETAFATSLLLIEQLRRAGAKVYVNDPYYTNGEIAKFNAIPASLDKLPEIDAAILVSFHRQYKKLNLKALKNAGTLAFIDGRNAFDSAKVEKAGMKYIGMGK
ncbi:MAG: nucleotide sugar dehydrogenase [Candidatus Diapherotrites archaeon]|nr:nucleotide sugar dehydrogenase [Candidatus Diapherotrites archaeon]